MSSRRTFSYMTFAVIFVSVYVNIFLNKSQANLPREPLSSFPKVLMGHEGIDSGFPNEILDKLGVDEYLMRRYSDGEYSIWLYIGYYRNQRDGAVPHSPRRCYPGSGFNPIWHDIGSIPVSHPGLKEIQANRYIFARGLEREIVIFWYQSRGRAIANEYMEKIILVRDAIFRNRSDGALVRFSIRAMAGTEEAAIRRLENFISVAYSEIPRFIPD